MFINTIINKPPKNTANDVSDPGLSIGEDRIVLENKYQKNVKTAEIKILTIGLFVFR